MHQFDKLRQPIRFSHSNIITLFLTNCTIELNKEKKNKTLQNSGYREQFNKTWNQIFPCTDYTSICVKHISTRHQMYGINLISLCTWIRINKKKMVTLMELYSNAFSFTRGVWATLHCIHNLIKATVLCFLNDFICRTCNQSNGYTLW